MEEKIKITGLLSRKEWTELSEKYDIFINTTNVDNTPVSVIEAMALGLVVVTTNVGGIPFLLNDKHDSLFGPPNDKITMKKNIEYLLNNGGSMFQKLSLNARAKAESFNWNSIRQQWLTLLS